MIFYTKKCVDSCNNTIEFFTEPDFLILYHCEIRPCLASRSLLVDADVMAMNIAACHGGYRGQI